MRERGQEEEEEEVPVVGLEEKQNHDQPAHLHQPEDAASLDAGNLLMAAALQVGLYYPSRAFGLLWHGLQRNGEKGRCLYEELLDRASNPSLFDVSSAQANLSSFRTASAIDSSLEGSFSIRQNQEGWYPHFLWSCFLRPRSQDDCRAFFAWTFVTASSLRQIYAAAPWCVSNGSTPASSSSEERSCETPGGRASGKPDGRSASLRTEDTLSAVPRGVREQDDAKERCVDGTARLHQEGSLEGLYAGEYYTGKNKKDYERSGGEREDQEGNNTMLVKTEKNTRRQKVTGIQTVPLSVSLKRQILIFCLAMRHLEEGGVCTSEVCLDGAGRGQSERRGRSTRDLSVQRSVNVGNFHHTEDSSGRGWTGKREEEAKKKIEGEKVEADDGKNSMPGGQRQPRLLEETCQTMGTVELWEKSDQRADGNEEPNSTRECVKPHDRHAATKTEGEEEQDDLAQQAKSEGDRRAKRDRNDVTLFYMFFSSLSVHTLQGLLGSLTENSSVSRPAVSEKKKEDFPRGRQSRLEDEVSGLCPPPLSDLPSSLPLSLHPRLGFISSEVLRTLLSQRVLFVVLVPRRFCPKIFGQMDDASSYVSAASPQAWAGYACVCTEPQSYMTRLCCRYTLYICVYTRLTWLSLFVRILVLASLVGFIFQRNLGRGSSRNALLSRSLPLCDMYVYPMVLVELAIVGVTQFLILPFQDIHR